MRDYKYRAVSVETKQWVYGGITSKWHHPEGKSQIVSLFDNEDESKLIFIDVLEHTIGQYTGLRDKHGKEIFGGDKLRIYDIGKGGEGETSFVDSVYYDENKGAWFVGYGWLYDHADKSEVEGTIHDKELKE